MNIKKIALLSILIVLAIGGFQLVTTQNCQLTSFEGNYKMQVKNIYLEHTYTSNIQIQDADNIHISYKFVNASSKYVDSCEGKLMLISQTKESLTFKEEITDGTCTGSIIKLSKSADKGVTFTWHDDMMQRAQAIAKV